MPMNRGSDTSTNNWENISNWFQNLGNDISKWFFTSNPFAKELQNMFDFNGSQAAQNQFNNQLALQQQAQNFNAAEAQKERDFQENMAKHGVQWKMEDIQAAGLNPYLAITNGINGATASMGASAQSSVGDASMANNKMVQAAGIIAMFLKFMAKK